MVKNRSEIYPLWCQHKKHQRYTKERRTMMLQLGFEWPEMYNTKYDVNPAEHLGVALGLAERYHITLHESLAGYRFCSARLSKEHWLRPINPNVRAVRLAELLSLNLDDNDEYIEHAGHTVQEAICGCLINARIAGVI